MDTTNSQMAKQIALAAMAFEQERIGRAPESVTVVSHTTWSALIRRSASTGMSTVFVMRIFSSGSSTRAKHC